MTLCGSGVFELEAGQWESARRDADLMGAESASRIEVRLVERVFCPYSRESSSRPR